MKMRVNAITSAFNNWSKFLYIVRCQNLLYRFTFINRVIALVLVLSLNVTAQGNNKEITKWIQKNAVQIKTVQPGSDFADMKALKSLVGDARIVSLGEATHGSREFFQLKHRIFEYLVKEKGFTLFGIEASFADCLAINDYVLYGKGDAEKALASQGYWTWINEEVMDLIQWMRHYNQDPKNAQKLKFYGFDIGGLQSAVKRAFYYLEKADAKIAEPLREPLKLVLSQPPDLQKSTPEQIAALRSAFRKGLADMVKAFEQNRGFLLKASSADDFGIAQRCAVTAAQIYEISLIQTSPYSSFGIVVEFYLFPRVTNSIGELKGYFEKNHPAFAIRAKDLLTQAGKPKLVHYFCHSINESQRTEWDKLTTEMSELLEKNKNQPNEAEWAKAKRYADDIVLGLKIAREYLTKPNDTETLRDRLMAENIAWILEHEGKNSKIVTWAHNAHVSFYEPTEPNAYSVFDAKRMGTYLEKRFGKDHLAFGFAFNEGGFQALNMPQNLQTAPAGAWVNKPFEVGPAKQGSNDYILAEPGIPLFLLDLRKAPAKGPVADWLNTPRPTRSIAASYNTEQEIGSYQYDALARHYDVVIFVEKTTPSHRLKSN